MTITETKLQGCFILEPNIFEDERGYFFESFNHKRFEKAIGREVNFLQDNQSFSSYGVLRGLHFQAGEHAQAKLVRVLSGSVWDIAVDIRPQSSTYGQYVGVELTAENKKQIFVPRGFAHGFVVLSDTAEVFYKCDNYYNKDAESGIIYNDAKLNIDWRLEIDKLIISEKDLELKEEKLFI